MKANLKTTIGGALCATLAIAISPIVADEAKKKERTTKSEAVVAAKEEKKAERPDPKPLSDTVKKGLAYLKKTQHESGGWGQGGGWRTNTKGGSGRVQGKNVEDPPDVGNTAVGLLTFIRAGESFEKGEYAETMTKAAKFLFDNIDTKDKDTLFVTDIRDTQLQSKIGRYVDTFLSALVLSEMKGKLPSPSMEEIRDEVLVRVIDKIEKNQKADGTFDGNAGWAAVLSQGIASTALNRAWVAGGGVADKTLRLDAANNSTGVIAGSVEIKAAAGKPSSAGIDLYRYAAQVGGLQGQAAINSGRKAEFYSKLKDPKLPEAEKKQVEVELAAIEKNDEDAKIAADAAAKQLKKAKFVAGFGNNGGEEFLSYMNLSEAMCAKGGQDWKDWDEKVTKTVNAAQNEDGSWAGQHCITGRTFCTATALLTLMADRAPIPEPVPEEKKEESDEEKKGKDAGKAEPVSTKVE